MPITISELKQWIECPQKAAYAQLRVSASPPPSLQFGTLFHAYMEQRVRSALSLPVDPLPTVSEEALAEWRKLEPHIEAWSLPPEWTLRGAEVPIRGTLPRWNGAKPEHQLQGRLDALVEWNHKLWSLQYKTCGQSVPLVNLAESVRMGFHEAAYQYLYQQHDPTPYGGTILVTLKKLSMKALREGSNPIAVHYLTRSKQEQQALLLDLSKALDSMEQGQVWHNWEACHGPFKNSRCPYFPVCHEHLPLSSDIYMDAVNRYPEFQEEA